jgi:hypothetical protein
MYEREFLKRVFAIFPVPQKEGDADLRNTTALKLPPTRDDLPTAQPSVFLRSRAYNRCNRITLPRSANCTISKSLFSWEANPLRTICTRGKVKRPNMQCWVREILLKLTTVMHFSVKEQMFGYPVLEMRQLMRAGANRRWGVHLITRTLGVQLDEAAKLKEKLLEEGFIEVHRDGLRYELTIKGER